jgi:N-acyl-D-amino-acid deacylase
MTSLTADKFRLTNRGRLAPGFYADIVIFDPEQIKDTATFENPTKQAAGIDRVYVNGVEVWQAGKPTVNRPGRALRRQELALEKQSQI